MTLQSLTLWVAALACAMAGSHHQTVEGAQIGVDTIGGSLMEIRSALESRASWDRESPFIERVFDPSLDGQWAGHAVSYGCYREGQAPGVRGPSSSEILEDLTIIKEHWNLIRIYGSDDDADRIFEVIREHRFPIRVMLGVWLEPEDDDLQRRQANIEQVARGIELARTYGDIIAAVNVGNETQVFWSAHRMQQATLIHYIRALRSSMVLPVTTADDYNFWNKPESRGVAREVDFVVTHMHPLWNSRTLEESVEWMEERYLEVQGVHPEKLVVIGETGWATEYDPARQGPGEQGTLMKGEVSVPAQQEFLIQLYRWVRTKRVPTFLFEAFDEPWKGGGPESSPSEVEKHWGVFYENRTPKESFLGFLHSINVQTK